MQFKSLVDVCLPLITVSACKTMKPHNESYVRRSSDRPQLLARVKHRLVLTVGNESGVLLFQGLDPLHDDFSVQNKRGVRCTVGIIRGPAFRLSCNPCIGEWIRSGGLMVRAPACRSRGRWFDSTYSVSKLGQFRSPHFARVFRKRH